MEFTRRQLLASSAIALFGGLAGCTEDGEVGSPNEEITQTPTATQTETATQTATETDVATETLTETPTETPQQAVAEIGEELVYTQGDQKLGFAITEASLHDAIITARSNRLSSRVPENQNHTFLSLQIKVENSGSERIRTPNSIVCVVDGQQYERSYMLSSEDRYQGYTEILPDTSSTGSMLFEIPPSDSEGRVVVDFSHYGESVTGEWRFNVGDLRHETFDYSGQNVGDSITFGANTTNYEMSVVDFEETQSYTTSGEYSHEEEPEQGNKFVLVSVSAKNTGDTPVYLPTIYDMSLRSGSSQSDADYYSGSNPYEGGEISPGVERSGIVQFELSQAASEYEFLIDLTQDIQASWKI